MISRRIDRRIASYCTAPLRGLMTHAKGGFYHDGRFADLMAVVEHYNQFLKLRLTDAERRDLIEHFEVTLITVR
jgi:cytochrome c peroxidase